jgi:hypothetical protein
MSYIDDFNLSEISKGRILRRVPVQPDEYFVVGDFHPEVGGWELRPNGKNLYRWEGVLLYIRPENIKGRFQLKKEPI